MKVFVQLLAIVFFMQSCGGGEPTTVASVITVTDSKGNEVFLKAPAKKIVSLFDPMVDALYMLQAQRLLVGIPAETYFDNELFVTYALIDDRIEKKSLATPGSNESVNIESVLQLQPDLVIAQHISEGMIKMLKDAGVAVYLASADTYENVFKEVTDLGKLTGKEERAQELVTYVQQQFEMLSSAASLVPKKKAVYFAWANGRIFSTTGRNSMMHSCLELAGVENACKTDIDQPNINPETLIQWNPDIIVMWNDSPDLFYNKQELKSITAIQNKDIYNLMPMFFYNPHTLKSLCATLAIKGWGEGKREVDKVQIQEVLSRLYGNEIAVKFKNIL